MATLKLVGKAAGAVALLACIAAAQQTASSDCSQPPPIWLHGKQIVDLICGDVELISNFSALTSEPYSVDVLVINHGQTPVVIGWADWALLTTHGGKNLEEPTLDPDESLKSISSVSIWRRMAIGAANGLSAASATQREMVTATDPSGGTTTATVYDPSAGASAQRRANNDSSREVAAVGAPRQRYAAYLSRFVLRKTTVLPAERLQGVIFFKKPKGSITGIRLKVEGRAIILTAPRPDGK